VKTRPRRLSSVLAVLRRSGLILKQDKHLPSVVTLLTGEAQTRSWWSHPEGRRLFQLMGELADHRDVIVTRLLLNKETYVHRSLWPQLLAVATAAERWQRAGLSSNARALLARTQHARTGVPATGPVARELTGRLLVHAQEVHTATGAHALLLYSWSTWARTRRVRHASSVAASRATLEMRARALGAPPGALPWEREG
jgi:hypothetical protein